MCVVNLTRRSRCRRYEKYSLWRNNASQGKRSQVNRWWRDVNETYLHSAVISMNDKKVKLSLAFPDKTPMYILVVELWFIAWKVLCKASRNRFIYSSNLKVVQYRTLTSTASARISNKLPPVGSAFHFSTSVSPSFHLHLFLLLFSREVARQRHNGITTSCTSNRIHQWCEGR